MANQTPNQTSGGAQRGSSGEAGKKGGQHSTGHEQDEKAGGSGNFANDHEKASEAGKKGDQHSHLGPSK